MKYSAATTLLLAASTAAFTPMTPKSTSPTQLGVWSDSDIFDVQAGRTDSYGYDNYAVNSYRRGGGDYYPVSSTIDKVEGGSRRTFDTAYTDSNMVTLETDSRPLDAKVEIWEGPNNTPATMKLWSEDGAARPWTAGFANFKGSMYGSSSSSSTGSSMTVDNKGALEFPLYANVNVNSFLETSKRQVIRIDGGGAQKSFNIGPGPHVIEIWSEGFPYYANVEVWDGPNTVKQSAEVYADSGTDRPWSAVIESFASSGSRGDLSNSSGGTIQIRNPGPVEYPFFVSVEPAMGGGYGRGGYGGNGGYGRGGYGGY